MRWKFSIFLFAICSSHDTIWGLSGSLWQTRKRNSLWIKSERQSRRWVVETCWWSDWECWNSWISIYFYNINFSYCSCWWGRMWIILILDLVKKFLLQFQTQLIITVFKKLIFLTVILCRGRMRSMMIIFKGELCF